MDNLITQITNLIGTSPNDEITFLYYVLAIFIVITSIKLIFKMIFDYIFNIKI